MVDNMTLWGATVLTAATRREGSVQDGYLSAREVREELDIFINSPATDYGYTIHDEL